MNILAALAIKLPAEKTPANAFTQPGLMRIVGEVLLDTHPSIHDGLELGKLNFCAIFTLSYGIYGRIVAYTSGPTLTGASLHV